MKGVAAAGEKSALKALLPRIQDKTNAPSPTPIPMSRFKYNRLDKANAAVLLVDHQSGLISLVQDFAPNEFKNNVLALANVAKFFELPTILTTSFENGRTARSFRS